MKLITINIEGDRHLDRVLSFIKAETPDVICLQEVFEPHLELFKALGYTTAFLPMTLRPLNGVPATDGIAICTKMLATELHSFLYNPASETVQQHYQARVHETVRNGVLIAHIPHEGDVYVIATTHFTWTPDGAVPNNDQRNDLTVLLEKLSSETAHILCGDFNIPRNLNPLYEVLARTYTDNIPTSYTSSLDKDLHRHGDDAEKSILFEKFMVDYVFSKPPYIVSDVRLQFGLSDHAGVVATITKQEK